jgi:hypothetical protein
MGKNTWRDEYEWPLERTEWTKFYLSSNGNAADDDGSLSTEIKTIDQTSDSFIYDPENPVPSVGSQYQTYDFCGPRDRSHIQLRPDVLTFTTDVLTEDLEITGPISATVWASSDAIDTDFTATLTDLEPEGKAIALCEGIVRARFRDGTENPQMIIPGKIYKFEIDMWNTSNSFNKGHRIRIEISSSNFPRYNRNLNSGNPIASDTDITIANQTVYHGSKYPSHINLPLIPAR